MALVMMMVMMNVDWRGLGLDGCCFHKPTDGECEVEDTSLMDNRNHQAARLLCQRSGGGSRWVDGTIADDGCCDQKQSSLHVVDHRRWSEES